MTEPLTDQQLTAIRSDIALAASGPMVGVPAGAGRYEAWERIGDQHGAALLAEVDRLRAALADGHYDSACIAVEERDRLRAELADLRACPCFPNPGDHADRCPIFLAAAPNSEDDQW